MPPGGPVLAPTTNHIKADVAALRSSNHLVGYSKARKNDKGPSGKDLPKDMKVMQKLFFENSEELVEAVKLMLRGSDVLDCLMERLEDVKLVDSALMKSDKGKSQVSERPTERNHERNDEL